jgi:NAD(P)-dependent dehydrogenase (short-subunit alcohol dehydrogenase family)
VITGAASGIGAAGAGLFAAHGAALVLIDLDRTGGQRVADAITARGGRAVFVAGDVASPDDVAGAVRTAVREFGRLDLLWANAGTGVAKTVPGTTLAEWDRVLAVNLTGAFLLAKYGIPELAAAGGGTMVITGSANSFTADRNWAAYCASKGGLLMLCKALALDHAADGIRVNIVCPGSVATPMHEDWLASRPGRGNVGQAREEDRAAHPLGRFAEPAEVARAALFLSCDDSSFTTGTPLLVDGGVTA